MRAVTRSRGPWLVLAAASMLWSCGGSSTPTTPTPNQNTPTAQTVSVNIVGSAGNTAYSPNPVAANVGDVVVFRNNHADVHHIVLDDGSADLGDIVPGATSRGLTVRSSSAVRYHCVNHPSMVGSINGASAPEPPDCTDPSGYGC